MPVNEQEGQREGGPVGDQPRADGLSSLPADAYSSGMMNDRGWGWSQTEIRLAQLIEWIGQQPADQTVSVVEFYAGLADQDMNKWDVAHSDLQELESRSLIKLSVAMGGIRGFHVYQFQRASQVAEELQTARGDTRARRQACRDAMVNWLHSRDATQVQDMAVRDDMLADPRRGIWLAAPFTPEDLDQAAAWLQRSGLVDGHTVDQAAGPIKLYLTDAGVRCVEGFDSYTGRYIEAKGEPGRGPTFNFGTNTGPIQVAGDNARQTQYVGTSLAEIRDLIDGIAEIVRAVVPDASEVDDAKRSALAAVTDAGVDRPALVRFRDWAVSTAKAGASSGITAAVSSATTALLMEVSHLIH